MTGDDEFEAMLRAPLAEPADAGFSARVMANVAATRLRRMRIQAGVLIAASAAGTVLLSATSAGQAIALAAETFGDSHVAAFTFAVFAVSALVARQSGWRW